MKKLLLLLMLLMVGFVAYAVCWPSPFAPAAWHADNVKLAQRGAFAQSQPIHRLTLMARGVATGPETVAIDNQGRLYAGYDDGTVRRFGPLGRRGRIVATTNGRPLGMVLGPPLPTTHPGAGSAIRDDRSRPANKAQPAASSRPVPQTLYVADAEKGLLAIDPGGRITSLATGANGKRFGLTDGVDVASDGTIYFTDASSKYGLDAYRDDILEHGGHGRLLRYDPVHHKTTVLLSGLQFANGVAVGPDDNYVLVTETGSYRVRRYWLKGPRAGQNDIFIDNLPGFPDGISFDGAHHFWLALFAPRNALLDFAADQPWLRQVIYHLPHILQPHPRHVTQVVGLNARGDVVASLNDRSACAFAPVTSVVKAGQQLYLGSLKASAFASIPVPDTQP